MHTKKAQETERWRMRER